MNKSLNYDEPIINLKRIKSMKKDNDSDPCRIRLIDQTGQHRFYETSLVELKTRFKIDFVNRSYLQLHYQKQPNSYLTTSVNSILECVIFKNSTVKFYVDPSLQPIIYVCSIFALFTVIFSLIMMFSYRINRQDADIAENKQILNDWASFKRHSNYRNMRLNSIAAFGMRFDKSQESLYEMTSRTAAAAKVVKFKIEDFSSTKPFDDADGVVVVVEKHKMSCSRASVATI